MWGYTWGARSWRSRRNLPFALLAVLTLAPSVSRSATVVDVGILRYEISGGAATLLGFRPGIDSYIDSYRVAVEVPEFVSFSDNRYPVDSIADGAFSYADTLDAQRITSLSLPSTLKKIGSAAFAYGAFNSIAIPEGVTSIEGGAFGAGSLQDVTLPSSLISIGNSAFQLNFLERVSIPEGVTEIGQFAFADNSISFVEFLGSYISGAEKAFIYQYDIIAGTTGVADVIAYDASWKGKVIGGTQVTVVPLPSAIWPLFLAISFIMNIRRP